MAQKAPPVQEPVQELKDKELVEDDTLYICDMIELEKLLKEKGMDRVISMLVPCLKFIH